MFKFIRRWFLTLKFFCQGDTLEDAHDAAVLTMSGFRRIIFSKKIKRRKWFNNKDNY
jgi:hypothetical protein